MWHKRIWSLCVVQSVHTTWHLPLHLPKWGFSVEGRGQDSSCCPALYYIVGRSESDLVSSCNLSKVPIPPSRSYLLGRTTNILQTLHGGPYVWRQVLSWQDPVSCLTWKTKISSVIVVVISDKLLELRSSYFTFMEDSEFLFINLDSWNLIDWGCYTEIVVRKCIIKIRVRMMGLSVATSQTLRTRD